MSLGAARVRNVFILLCILFSYPAYASESFQLTLNIIWIVIMTGLVFFMQAGFTMLESGMVRAKNSYNVALKNVSDLCAAIVTFWLFGFAIMFGASVDGWFGFDGFFGNTIFDAHDMAFFAFQATFDGTAATIVAGSVAERMKFSAYIIVLSFMFFFRFLGGRWKSMRVIEMPLGAEGIAQRA